MQLPIDFRERSCTATETCITEYLLLYQIYENFPLCNSEKAAFDRIKQPSTDVLRKKVFWKYAAEHQCWSVISIKFLCKFIEIALRRGCSHANCCIFSEHLSIRGMEGCLGQMFFRIGVLKNFALLVWVSPSQAWGPATLWKRDSSTGVFRWIFKIIFFIEHASGDSFWISPDLKSIPEFSSFSKSF